MHRTEPGFTRLRSLALAPALLLALGIVLAGGAGCGRTGLYSIEDDGGVRYCPPSCPDFGGDGDGFPHGRDDMPPGGDDGPPGPPDFAGDGPDCRLLLEDCGNGVDDNCDGLIDCKDPGCAADKRCGMPGVEICNNGVDDDQNTFIDCLDPACLNFPGCEPQHMCNVNMPDCKDPACVDHPACQNLVCKPTVDFGALAHNDARSQKVIATAGTIDVAKTQCAPAGGGQVVTTFEVLDNATTVRMDFTQPMNSDHAFGLFRAGVNQRCEANPIDCFDPKAMPSGTHTWVLDKGRYYLIVIAVTKIHQGSADVTLTTPPIARKETCNNGVDDDGNGLIDCADPVCINDPACVKNICRPDVILGTIVPTNGQPQSGKLAQFDTHNGNPNFAVQCGGKGMGRVVQFTLAETAGIALAVESDTGDHVFGLYRLPPLGQPCDAMDLKSCDLARVGAQEALGDFAPGTYLMIFQAIKPGDEGAIDVWIFTYKNKRVELCNNKIDDDNNGLTDCADPACAGEQACGPPICSPDVDFGNLVIGQPAKSTVLNLVGGVPNLKSACAMGGGRSRVVQFTLAASGGLQLGCNQQSGQAVMGLYAVAGPPRQLRRERAVLRRPADHPLRLQLDMAGDAIGHLLPHCPGIQARRRGLAHAAPERGRRSHPRDLQQCQGRRRRRQHRLRRPQVRALASVRQDRVQGGSDHRPHAHRGNDGGGQPGHDGKALAGGARLRGEPRRKDGGGDDQPAAEGQCEGRLGAGLRQDQPRARGLPQPGPGIDLRGGPGTGLLADDGTEGGNHDRPQRAGGEILGDRRRRPARQRRPDPAQFHRHAIVPRH